MENRKFQRAHATRRAVAVLFTMLFHFALLGSLFVATSGDGDSVVKDVKEWIFPDSEVAAEENPEKA